MRIFDFEDYAEFIVQSIQGLPKGGHGELRRLAAHVGIHSSTLSQILKSQKNFTLEQACLVAEYFGLNDLEYEFLLLLVNYKRAGSSLLREKLKQKILRTREQSAELKNVLHQDRELNLEERAVFYSNWYYTAIWALSSIPGYQTRELLQPAFPLPKLLVNQVIDFLLKTGICIEKSGLIQPGLKYVHLPSNSPLLPRHHANWRVKAMERHPLLTKDELAYTSPMSMSFKDVRRVREILVDCIARINEIRDPSPCETLVCLNLDWFKIGPLKSL